MQGYSEWAFQPSYPLLYFLCCSVGGVGIVWGKRASWLWVIGPLYESKVAVFHLILNSAESHNHCPNPLPMKIYFIYTMLYLILALIFNLS